VGAKSVPSTQHLFPRANRRGLQHSGRISGGMICQTKRRWPLIFTSSLRARWTSGKVLYIVCRYYGAFVVMYECPRPGGSFLILMHFFSVNFIGRRSSLGVGDIDSASSTGSSTVQHDLKVSHPLHLRKPYSRNATQLFVVAHDVTALPYLDLKDVNCSWGIMLSGKVSRDSKS